MPLHGCGPLLHRTPLLMTQISTVIALRGIGSGPIRANVVPVMNYDQVASTVPLAV